MSTVSEEVVVDLIARTNRLEQGLRDARRQFENDTDRMTRASDEMRRRMEANNGAIGDTFKKLSGALGAYFSGQQVVALTESFTRFQNSLRVAGVASADLGAVQERLFASAQKYGVEIGTLGSLFGSLTNASKELGVSQEQIFQLTDTVSASLKVSGQSAQEASGALLQLSQALRGGKIQAEEYNSLLDGAFPLLEAAAAGSDRFGGSVGKLTALVKDGKVSSREFFDAILAGSEDVMKRAEMSTLSLSGAYTQLTNALTIYVGEAATSSGAQAAVAAAIEKIAANLDTLIPALAVVAGAMGVKYVLSAAAAQAATLRADAALLGLTTRAQAAGYAFASLATSIAINGAILAVTAAIGAMGVEVATTESLIRNANTQFDEMKKRLEASAAVASSASDGARSVGDGAASAEPKVRSFAGAVGELADQLFRQAKAAKEARIEGLEKNLADSRAAELELSKRTPAGRNNSQNDFRRGDLLNNAGVIIRGIVGGGKSILSGGRTDREATEAYSKQVAISMGLGQQLADARKRPLETFVPTGGGGASASSGAAGGKGRKGPSGKTAEQIQDEQNRIAQQITAAQLGYLQELAQTTQNASDRALLEQQVIEATRAANEQDIQADRNLNNAQRERLLEINNQVAQLRAEQAQAQEVARVRQERLAITSDALRDEDRLRQVQSQLASSSRDRRDIELRRVDIAYRLEQLAVAEELKQAEISGDLDRIAAARKRLADIEARRVLDVEGAKRATESPLERRRREVREAAANMGDAIENIEVNAVDRLADGLANASKEYIKLGGIAGDVINGIIADLVKLAVQQAVFGNIGGGAAGSGGFFGGLVSGVTKLFRPSASTPTMTTIPGFASGTNYAPGGLAVVGEEGPEVVELPRGSRVIPNHDLNARAAASMAGVSAARANPVQQTVVVKVEANDYFDARVDSRATRVATPIARQQANQAAGASFAAGQQSAPGTINKYNQLKG